MFSCDFGGGLLFRWLVFCVGCFYCCLFGVLLIALIVSGIDGYVFW